MNSASAQKLLDSIDQTILDIDGISGSNPLLDSYLAKFLVTYICGIYEEVIETILVEFTSRNTTRIEINSFVAQNLADSFRNPDYSNLIKLIKKFDNPAWEAALKKFTSETRALDSIVANKNALAHGRPTLVTLLDVKQYYAESRVVIEKLDELAI